MILGRLTPVDIRLVWLHEANDFTPWLAREDNIDMLGDALQLGPLEVEATERDVGRFSADIVARDDTGRLILIENQLEQTDHRHLGQVLTYLAGLEEHATVIWLATRFLEEHRAAIDWLNENTNEHFEFFGVELGVVRIGDSDPAPVFNVVAKPNDWSREVRSIARQVSDGVMSDRQQLLLRYWAAFGELLAREDKAFRRRKPNRDHWMNFALGRTGFHIAVTSLVKEKRVGVELYLSRTSAKADFARLATEQSQINAEFEEELVWDDLPGRKGSRISVVSLPADPNDENDWLRQQEWARLRVSKFKQIFTGRIASLPEPTGYPDPFSLGVDSNEPQF
jgi:hypothetical protein